MIFNTSTLSAVSRWFLKHCIPRCPLRCRQSGIPRDRPQALLRSSALLVSKGQQRTLNKYGNFLWAVLLFMWLLGQGPGIQTSLPPGSVVLVALVLGGHQVEPHSWLPGWLGPKDSPES